MHQVAGQIDMNVDILTFKKQFLWSYLSQNKNQICFVAFLLKKAEGFSHHAGE